MSRPRYEDDFHAWLLDQAHVLREMASAGYNGPLDPANLAEEVEDLGNEQRHACESWIEQIIAHLLKLEYAKSREDRAHWETEIVAFRSDLQRKMTRTIERAVRGKLEQLYRTGRRLAESRLRDADPDLGSRLPASCPYTYEEITADDWYPPSPAE